MAGRNLQLLLTATEAPTSHPRRNHLFTTHILLFQKYTVEEKINIPARKAEVNWTSLSG
jgi:hypothetical protein